MESTNASLRNTVRDDMAAYVRHLAGRVERITRSIPPEKLWVRPFPFGNSVGNLVLHLTGNLNHYVGTQIAGSGYQRDRDREFTDPGGYPLDEILRAFQAAAAMVTATILSLDAEDFCRPQPDETPLKTTFGLLLKVIAHLNNHIGQMSYLQSALGPAGDEPPSW